ncbi:MAG TPA: acyltransferase [Allosphingosinicella sp.]|jgi:peptidoglycan/LPS O-acetylase OafA/YrhL
MAAGIEQAAVRQLKLRISEFLRWPTEQRDSGSARASLESSLPRSSGLDAVRACAILWVMIYHAANFDLVPDADHWFVRFGWMGVDLFFGLSGFLIAGQLLKPWAIGSRPDYRRFFSRRALRILPGFVAVTIIYFTLPAARERSAIQPLWQFVTFTENLLIQLDAPKAFSHVWSLCVEEHFYLIFPPAVALLASARWRPAVGLAFAAVLMAGMATRSWLWLAHVSSSPFDWRGNPDPRLYLELIYYPTWTRLDGLLAGVALAAVKLFCPAAWRRLTLRPNLLLLLGLGGMAASMWLFGDQITGLVGSTLGFPLLSMSVALVLAAAGTDVSALSAPPQWLTRSLATGAYSLYLTHKIAFHIVIEWVAPRYDVSGYAKLGLSLATALVCGAALYALVERPFLRLRDRLEGPSRSSIARPSPRSRPADSHGEAVGVRNGLG